MDISTFRWILIVVGIAIVLGIFLFGSPDKKRKPKASRKTRAKRKPRATRKRSHAKRVRREPAIESTHDEAPDLDDEGDARQAELDIDGLGRREERIEPILEAVREIKPKPVAKPLPDKIVSLFLQARDNHIITGVELLDASLKSGLVFGERDIFHRIHEEDVEPVFSMANLTKPGSFDKDAWNTMEIRGVTMFMTLPGPRNALDAWDAMLATSRRLAELLHADLLDERHRVFTRERSLQIKEEMREYERQKNAD
jgi:cell division protein ZipA